MNATPTRPIGAEDLAPIDRAYLAAPRLPRCSPIVATPLSACSTDWLQIARDTLEDGRYSPDDLACIAHEAEKLSKRCDISPESAVEDVIALGTWL